MIYSLRKRWFRLIAVQHSQQDRVGCFRLSLQQQPGLLGFYYARTSVKGSCMVYAGGHEQQLRPHPPVFFLHAAARWNANGYRTGRHLPQG